MKIKSERYEQALKAIAGMAVNNETDHTRLTALMIAIARNAFNAHSAPDRP